MAALDACLLRYVMLESSEHQFASREIGMGQGGLVDQVHHAHQHPPRDATFSTSTRS